MDESLSNKIFQFERGNTVHGKRSKKLVPNASSGGRLKVKDVKEAVKKLMSYYCEKLPRKSNEYCGVCKKCKKFIEIFGKGLANG